MVVGPRAGLKDGNKVQPKVIGLGGDSSAEIVGTPMSRFAINTPYLIIVICLIIAILGAVSVVQMPVDMFPSMNIPVVVVATFYSGMPPEQIEGDITYHLERFFTLASGIDHIESRSLNGVSIIRVYFQSNTERGYRRRDDREPGGLRHEGPAARARCRRWCSSPTLRACPSAW